jgi:hypothetical protein
MQVARKNASYLFASRGTRELAVGRLKIGGRAGQVRSPYFVDKSHWTTL